MHASAIRPLLPDDLPALRSVIDGTGLFPSELLSAMAEPFLAGEAPDRWWVAVENGMAVGVVYCAPERMTDRAWNLLLIAVLADRQGQGWGGRLTRHAEAALQAEGARILLVETSGLLAFARTRNVYARLGYAEEARIRDFYAEGEDKVVYWKRLSPAAH